MVVDLSKEDIGLPVVRVVIPGLEGPDDHDGYVPGERARAHTGGPPMNAIIFCGPTLRRRGSSRPTAASSSGRLFVRASSTLPHATGSPRAIGVIDGYFDGQPAVLHKEILWALTQRDRGVRSVQHGCASCGGASSFRHARRRRIFEAYRDGELTDDDEVALIHGPPETGYVSPERTDGQHPRDT